MTDDHELIAGMVRGEARAFAELYERHRSRLRQYALSLLRSATEAEDVVHEVFIGLAKQATAGNPPRDAARYLYASIRHRCLDRLRRSRERALTDHDLELFIAPPGDETRAGLRHVLQHALLSLPPEQVEVVVLRTWHDLDFAAIAALQGTPLSTALSRWRYALDKLRQELATHGG